MNQSDYEYLMSLNYNCLKEIDILNYNMKSFGASSFNIYYICENLTFSVSYETNQINTKFTEDEFNGKKSFYNLPAEVNYNFKGNLTSILYKIPDMKGKPDKIIFNYAQNGLLIEPKFFWHDQFSICINKDINKFFNTFFNEKIFDITTEYDQSVIFDTIIYFHLNKRESELLKIFKDLGIKNLDHLKNEDTTILELLIY